MPKDKCDLQCSMLFRILMWFQVKKQTQMHYYTDQRMSVTYAFSSVSSILRIIIIYDVNGAITCMHKMQT